MAERLKHYPGYLLALAALLWVLHDVHPRDLAQGLVVHHPAWLVLAISADILSYVMQAIRWRLFLTPVGQLSTRRATQAIYAGLFVNEIVPLRLGEVVRAYLAARWMPARFTSVLTTLAFERFTDGVWLIVGAGVAAAFVRLPADLIRTAKILGVLLFSLMALMLILARFGRCATRGRLNRAARTIRSATTAPAFWLAILSSSLVLLLQTLAFWFVIKAYALPFYFWTGAVVFLIVRLGTAIPNAPANVGTFQFFVVAGLTFFGLDKSTAAAFSVAAFVVLTVPLWLIGFFALSRTGLTLDKIRLGIGEQATAALEPR